MKKKDRNKIKDNSLHDFDLNHIIKNVKANKPYVDASSGMVFWGTDASQRKERGDRRA